MLQKSTNPKKGFIVENKLEIVARIESTSLSVSEVSYIVKFPLKGSQ
jgi:hypothetical protein